MLYYTPGRYFKVVSAQYLGANVADLLAVIGWQIRSILPQVFEWLKLVEQRRGVKYAGI